MGHERRRISGGNWCDWAVGRSVSHGHFRASFRHEDIDAFVVRYFDGRDWQIQWPEEQAAPPELVEVTLASNTSVGATQVTESFIVNLKKARLRSTIQDLGQQQQQQQQQPGRPEPQGEQGQGQVGR